MSLPGWPCGHLSFNCNFQKNWLLAVFLRSVWCKINAAWGEFNNTLFTKKCKLPPFPSHPPNFRVSKQIINQCMELELHWSMYAEKTSKWQIKSWNVLCRDQKLWFMKVIQIETSNLSLREYRNVSFGFNMGPAFCYCIKWPNWREKKV